MQCDFQNVTDTLSAPLRKEILSRVPEQYADKSSLVDMIYEAVFICVQILTNWIGSLNFMWVR